MIARGTVYLIGAGPGDPGLITRRGLELLRAADVIVYDRLANPELLLEARPDARLIYVGKSPDRHALKQEEINQLLGDEALAGHSVCRLKGGDPFLFGRGGEEADHLHARGVPFVIVPGVTSAIAVPAYAGIPVTDRRAASSLAIATGHEEAGTEESDVDWAALGRAADTLVMLMGMKHLSGVVQELLAAGRAPTTPAAVIQWGTTGRQRALYSELGRVVEDGQAQGFGNPSIFILGEVVKLAKTLTWRTEGPLQGLRILVTRPRHQASALAELLRAQGAEPVVCSVVKITPLLVVPERLREVMSQSWDWVLFTSANGVTTFRDHLRHAGLDWRVLSGAKLGAIGPGTAKALEATGLRADFVPSQAIAESLAGELPNIAPGTRVLLARAQEARDVLPDTLKKKGATVEVLDIYRTEPDAQGLSLLSTVLAEGDLDVITLTSSSSARALVEAAGLDAVQHLPAAAIGPITAQTARALGLNIVVEAKEHTLPGLLTALIDWKRTR